jgi:phytoene dehydrogenase-like protein
MNSRKKESIIIIGGGIAGLAAGCYGQKYGYKTQIFEQNNIPGGLCTSWKREGYMFDTGISFLAGSNGKFGSIWEDLGLIGNVDFYNKREYLRVEDSDNKKLIFHTNVDKLEKHLVEISPEDKKFIKKFCFDIRRLSKFPWSVMEKPMEIMNFFERFKLFLKIIPYLNLFIKYSKISIEEFALKFQNSFLKKVIPYSLYFNTPEPMLSLMMILSWMSINEAGTPIGGSLNLAKKIENNYIKLGGKINYNSKVEKIITKETNINISEAIGVCLSDGKEFFADLIISAIDGYATLFDLLKGKFVNEYLEEYYKKQPIFPSIIQISLGIDKDLSKRPNTIKYILDNPKIIASQEKDSLYVRHFCFDNSFAAEKKSVLIVQMETEYKFWQELRREKKKYDDEKKRVANIVIDILEEKYPDLRECIEVVDVSTPITFERYTGNWKGSIMGWLSTTEKNDIENQKILPSLQNFFMIGQWTLERGGLPSVAMSGRNIIQLLGKNT